MNFTELKSQVEDLKLMLLEPKLYVKKYFEDLINQLDLQTTKFQIEKDRDRNEVSTNIIEESENWRQLMLEQLGTEECKLLNKLSSNYQLDFDLSTQAHNIIELITQVDSSQNVLSLEEYDELEKKVYDYSYQIKINIMSNQCFVVLNSVSKAYKVKNQNIKSIHLWRNIFPIVRVNGGFIDTNGQKYLG